jgi:hypothetical protein
MESTSTYLATATVPTGNGCSLARCGGLIVNDLRRGRLAIGIGTISSRGRRETVSVLRLSMWVNCRHGSWWGILRWRVIGAILVGRRIR